MRNCMKAAVLFVFLTCGCATVPPTVFHTGQLVYYEYGYDTYIGIVLRDEGDKVVIRGLDSKLLRKTIDKESVYGPMTKEEFDIEQAEEQRAE